MHRLIYVFIVAVFCTCTSQQQSQDKLLGKVTNMRYAVLNANPDSLNLGSIVIDEYDKEGNRIFSSYQTPEKEIMMNFKNEFMDGKKTKVNWINDKDSLVRYSEIYYDENGVRSSEKSFTADGELISTQKGKWENNGMKETRKAYDKDGKENEVYVVFYYNDKEDIIKEIEYDKDSIMASYIFEYGQLDEQGNWQENKTFLNDTLVSMEKRTLEYRE